MAKLSCIVFGKINSDNSKIDMFTSKCKNQFVSGKFHFATVIEDITQVFAKSRKPQKMKPLGFWIGTISSTKSALDDYIEPISSPLYHSSKINAPV